MWQTLHVPSDCSRVKDLRADIGSVAGRSSAPVWNRTWPSPGPWHASQSTPSVRHVERDGAPLGSGSLATGALTWQRMHFASNERSTPVQNEASFGPTTGGSSGRRAPSGAPKIRCV